MTVLGLGRGRRGALAEKSLTGNLFSFQLLSFALVLTGCDSPDTRVTAREGLAAVPPGPSPTALANLLGVDAGELESQRDPPAPAGDLKAEIDRFTTLDACALDHARLDPLVGDALEAIGYETFLRDACRVIDAAKANDASRCAAIDASSLEARCRATVAQVAGTPDDCPWETVSKPRRGRDARCLAVATRDSRLCAAVADETDRATCEATLELGDRPCAKLRSRTAQLRCTRDAARWRNVLASAKPGPSGTPLVSAGRLHVAGADRNGSPETIDVDMAPDIAGGVTILQERGGLRFTLGPLTDAGLDFIAPSPHVRASLALEVAVVPAAHGGADLARIERAELVVPGRSALSAPAAQSTLTAKIEKLDPVRASPVVLSIDGDISGGASSWHVHLQVTTFVRDVVKASDVYGIRPNAWHDGGPR
jgi:hypothetical protein